LAQLIIGLACAAPRWPPHHCGLASQVQAPPHVEEDFERTNFVAASAEAAYLFGGHYQVFTKWTPTFLP
jgi:hypothetical protein